MPQNSAKAGLFGISSANFSRYGTDLLGKKQFSSTFPIALCLYMGEKKVAPVSVLLQYGRHEMDNEYVFSSGYKSKMFVNACDTLNLEQVFPIALRAADKRLGRTICTGSNARERIR